MKPGGITNYRSPISMEAYRHAYNDFVEILEAGSGTTYTNSLRQRVTERNAWEDLVMSNGGGRVFQEYIKVPVSVMAGDIGQGVSETVYQTYKYDYDSLRYIPVMQVDSMQDPYKKQLEEERQKKEKLLNIISYFYNSR